MPCGTDRSDPVQMLKITPVLPGAMMENELITPTRTITATRPVSTLLVSLASCSGESKAVLMIFFLVRGVGREVRHVNRGPMAARMMREEFTDEKFLQPALKRPEKK